jgi:hypothetical protein
VGNSWVFLPKASAMSRSAYWCVSVIAMNGLAFDLSTPHGRMMATIIAGIADFERELLQERIRSGIAAAKARGKRLGRQPGQRPKSDRLTPKVLALVAEGRSYRLIGRELGLSKNTVVEIIKRNRARYCASMSLAVAAENSSLKLRLIQSASSSAVRPRVLGPSAEIETGIGSLILISPVSGFRQTQDDLLPRRGAAGGRGL